MLESIQRVLGTAHPLDRRASDTGGGLRARPPIPESGVSSCRASSRCRSSTPTECGGDSPFAPLYALSRPSPDFHAIFHGCPARPAHARRRPCAHEPLHRAHAREGDDDERSHAHAPLDSHLRLDDARLLMSSWPCAPAAHATERRGPASRRRGARGHRGGCAAPRGHESRARHSGGGVARCRGEAWHRRRGQPAGSGSALRSHGARRGGRERPRRAEHAAGAEGRREGGGGLRVEFLAPAPESPALAQLLVRGPAPAKGLDPALQSHAAALSARGDEYVYGFVLLRDRLDEPTEDALARLGAELLGRHDDTYKARLPVASLAAIAAMPRGGVGRREPAASQAEPRAGCRARREGRGRRHRRRHAAADLRQSLRGGRDRLLPPGARGRRRQGRRLRRGAPLLPRGGHRARHREDRRPRLRAVHRAHRAGLPRPRPEHPNDRWRHPASRHSARAYALQRRADPGGHHGQRLQVRQRRAPGSVHQGRVHQQLHHRFRPRIRTTGSGTAPTSWARSPATEPPATATRAWRREWAARRRREHQGRQDLHERRHGQQRRGRSRPWTGSRRPSSATSSRRW